MSVEAHPDGPDPLRPPGRAGDLAAELVTYDPALTKLADLVAIADRRSERTRAQGLLRAGGSATHDDGAHDVAPNHHNSAHDADDRGSLCYRCGGVGWHLAYCPTGQ